MEIMFYAYESDKPTYAKVSEDTYNQIRELLNEWCLYEEVRISNWVIFFYILLCQLTFVHTRE